MSRSLVSVSLLLLLLVAAAWPQDSRGSITGKVVDPQGAVVPGVPVVVVNTETNTTVKTQTNATGYFEVNLLNPGSYSITVEATGFKKAVRAGLQLNVGGRL